MFPSDLTSRLSTTDDDDLEEDSPMMTKRYFANATTLFESCSYQEPSLTCSFEAVLFASIILLLVQEILQAYALGLRRYVREFENILELIVIALAITGCALQYHMKILKWVSAFGICLAYLELIFLMGRYPFLGGSISLMFYRYKFEL